MARRVTDGRRLKILFVIGSFGRGGAEGQLCRLAIELHERGHRVTVAALSDGGPLTSMLDDAGVSRHIFGQRRSSRVAIARVAVMIRAAYRVALLMRSERPDVCHAWLWSAYVVAIPIATVFGVPVRIAALRALRQPKERSVLGRALSSPARRLANGVSANSHAVAADALAQRLFSRTTPMRVIHNAIDIPARPADPGVEPPVVICVANLIAYKDHRTAIDAWNLLDDPPELRLVGDGPERKALCTQIARLDLTSSVKFIGSVADPSPLVRDSQVALLSSLTEGFPNAVLEAMAVGLPVVATDVGGVSELIDDSCGVLVRSGDPSDLAAAIRLLCSDPELRRRLGAAGRDRARTLSWLQCAVSYEHYYRELLRE